MDHTRLPEVPGNRAARGNLHVLLLEDLEETVEPVHREGLRSLSPQASTHMSFQLPMVAGQDRP